MSLPKLNNMAPSFTLLDQEGNKVSLKDFRGKKNVVLYFYPKALTPGCTTQACSIRDHKNEFKKLDTVVFGVSPDGPEKLKKFTDKEKLNFSLLSDPDLKVINKYGVWGLKKFMGKEYMGLIRTSFIIGKDGRIKHILDKVKTKTHHSEVMSFIKENLD